MSEGHWLWRLPAPAWLQAAQRELEQALAQLDQRRKAVAHLRRSAGMALNAVLVASHRSDTDEATVLRWGRSYVEHLQAIATGRALDPLPKSAATLAQQILAAPMQPPALVPLAGGRNADLRDAARATQSLLALCADTVGATTT